MRDDSTGRGRKRGPGVDVDHEAINRARLAAGLSLADVAGDRLSRTAVHRVETGKVRPSLATLQVIADRLGTTVERFLLPRPGGDGGGPDAERLLEVVRLERMSLAGDHAGVLTRATEVLATEPPPGVAARLHHLVGIAHVNQTQPAVGIIHLRQAEQLWAGAGDDRMAVEARGWMARALEQMQDASAADVALEALRRCRELDPAPLPTEARILGHLASIYLHRHEWERAIATYTAAVEAHGQVRDLAATAKMYDGLSIAHQGLGDIPTATRYAEMAMTLTSISADRAAQARMENNLGVLLLRAQRWSDAERHLRLALEHCDAAGITYGRSHVLLSLGQLAEARGDSSRAEAYVHEAVEHAELTGETATVALGYQWMGRIMCAAGRYEESDRAFERALFLLAGLNVPRRLAECHREYARALQEREDLARAVVHWQQAAELALPPVDEVASTDWIDTQNVAN
jgi:tetratricopeptide (TPR) repeat protein/transcriptional regulator with XRE-family HTH domain